MFMYLYANGIKRDEIREINPNKWDVTPNKWDVTVNHHMCNILYLEDPSYTIKVSTKKDLDFILDAKDKIEYLLSDVDSMQELLLSNYLENCQCPKCKSKSLIFCKTTERYTCMHCLIIFESKKYNKQSLKSKAEQLNNECFDIQNESEEIINDNKYFYYRPHMGDLTESLIRIVPFNSKAKLISYLIKCFGNMVINEQNIIIKPYGYDKRCDWDCHIVTLDGYGVLGFTNRQI